MQRIILKRLVTIAAMASMVLAITVPALAGVSNTGNSQNVVGQDPEQQVESGDATQNMSVTGGGDNSNQCFGDSSVANTGNATNAADILQVNSEDVEVEIDDSADFEISPESSTSCVQQVNQAATASG